MSRFKSQFPVAPKTLLVLRFLYVKPGASPTDIAELLDLYPRQAAGFMRRRMLNLKLIKLRYCWIGKRQMRLAYNLSSLGFEALSANSHL